MSHLSSGESSDVQVAAEHPSLTPASWCHVLVWQFPCIKACAVLGMVSGCRLDDVGSGIRLHAST